MDESTRQCGRCRQFLPLDRFSGRPERLKSWCKACDHARYEERKRDTAFVSRKRQTNASHYLANRDEYLRRAREYHQSHPVQVKTRCYVRRQHPLYRLDKSIMRAMRKVLNARGRITQLRAFAGLDHTPVEFYAKMGSFLGRPCIECGIPILDHDNAAISRNTGRVVVFTEADVLARNALSNIRIVCRACAFGHNPGRWLYRGVAS